MLPYLLELFKHAGVTTVVVEAAIYPSDTSMSRRGAADTSMSRRGAADTSMSRRLAARSPMVRKQASDD